MENKPPCELDSVDECTPKKALECLKLIKETEDELPRVIGRAQFILDEAVKRQRKKIRDCLMERFTSEQFDTPDTPKEPLK